MKVSKAIALAYLAGAYHDGTYNVHHHTVRFSQKEIEWLGFLQVLLNKLGQRSWIYKEGKSRNVWALETAMSSPFDTSPFQFHTTAEKIAYIRGYFDAEGGIPSRHTYRFYIQFCQKNRQELSEVRKILEDLRIVCGKIHNPSHVKDPGYFRFYISSQSWERYINLIGSWHPRKQSSLNCRMKI